MPFFKERVEAIEHKLLSNQKPNHIFISHQHFAQAYRNFKSHQPDTFLVLNEIKYNYILNTLSETEIRDFIQEAKDVYGEKACSYNETFQRASITLPLDNNIPPLQGFDSRSLVIKLFDKKGNYLGHMGLNEKNTVDSFSFDIFLNESSQVKGVGTKAVRDLCILLDDPTLDCGKINLAVGSQNPKAALVYARAGFKPTEGFLKQMAEKYQCSLDEAYAKILIDSSTDTLDGIKATMERMRNSPSRDIPSHATEKEMLAYLSSAQKQNVQKV